MWKMRDVSLADNLPKCGGGSTGSGNKKRSELWGFQTDSFHLNERWKIINMLTHLLHP